MAGDAEAYRFMAPSDDWVVSGPGVSWNIRLRDGGVSANLQVNEPTMARGFGLMSWLPRHWSDPALPGFPEGSVYGELGSVLTRPYRGIRNGNQKTIGSTRNYGEAIRGTETFADPGVGNTELPGGCGGVWATGTGSYVLSNDPLLDPNQNSTVNWERIDPS